MSAREHGTSDIVDQLLEEARSDGEDGIPLGRVVDRFGRRGFGGLVLFLTLPAFIPAPFGIFLGPMLGLTGLQLLLGFSQPWLPQRIRRFAIPRARLQRLSQRLGNGLRRVERFARPRWPWCGEGPGQLLSGLTVIVLGTLLALPIPFTNWPFGIVLCLFALGLIERDGALIVFGWVAATACIGVLVATFHGLIDWLPELGDWFGATGGF